jgi:hypothetical protein
MKIYKIYLLMLLISILFTAIHMTSDRYRKISRSVD